MVEPYFEASFSFKGSYEILRHHLAYPSGDRAIVTGIVG